jgi:oligogalacturonide lyase
MPRDTVRTLAFTTQTDPDTGARLTRLTPPDAICHRLYFYQKCFTQDGRRLVFGGGFGPDPDWHYHLLDLDSGECRQLTDQPGENTFGGFLTPDDRALIFVRDKRQLVRLELASLRETVAYTVPDGWVGYGTWVANTACTKMVGIEIRASDWFPLSDWQKFREMFFRRPRCRLIRIDLATGQRETIHEDDCWLGHPQYRPHDDHTVAFCHEGNHDLVDARMWFIDEDGRNLRCGKRHAPGESCTHEFWVPDGSAMVYVSYLKGRPERCIRALDPVTLADRELTVMPPCSHLMSNHDGTLIVGDGCASPSDVDDAHGYAIEPDPYLHLFDLRNGSTRRIARHDSSWSVIQGDRQVTHPHPSFTPDERQVLFSGDKAGAPGLWLADL